MDGVSVKSLDIQPTIDDDNALDTLIPRRKLPAANPVNGSISNGAAPNTLNSSVAKRSASDMAAELSSPLAKRPRRQSNDKTRIGGVDGGIDGKAAEPILVDDNGAILIDDD